jgi:RNA-binding motif X-linked protein 2
VWVGGLSYDLTEGDVVTVFSQWGEIADVNLPRDAETGKTKGFCFIMFEDQRSTVLAVDNMNGAQVLGRTLRCDHVREYRQPGKKNEGGDWEPAEQPTYNARPKPLDGECLCLLGWGWLFGGVCCIPLRL